MPFWLVGQISSAPPPQAQESDVGSDTYTPDEVAKRWKCSAAHVRNLITNGELEAFRLGGKLLRIKGSAIEDYERCHSTSCNGSVEGGPRLPKKAESELAAKDLRAAMRQARQRSSLASSRN